MSRITDSIYYTPLSDGYSSEQAAQSARSFYDPFHVDRFDFRIKLANRNWSLCSVGSFRSGNVYVSFASKGLVIPVVSR